MAADRLLIFAERPAVGRVMAGLVPPLPPDEAAAVYEACLRDSVALAARERARIELWYTESDHAREYFEAQFAHLPRVAQLPGGLGAKLCDAFAWSFADHAGRTVILRSDAPALPDERLTAAFADLREADVVLGPGHDGGWIIVGARTDCWPAAATLFDASAWAERTVSRVTMERAAAAGITLRVLPGWYDIGTVDGLRRARADAAPDSHLGRWLASPAARRYIGA